MQIYITAAGFAQFTGGGGRGLFFPQFQTLLQ
jgi:hypothetical protein